MAKAILRGKFIAIGAYIKKKKKKQTSKLNTLMIYFKILENKNKPNPKLAHREK
jgi:hypothetical protein